MFADNPDLTLRRAAPDDAKAVHDLVCAAFARHVPALGRKPRPMLADYAFAVRAHEVWLVEMPEAAVAVLELIAAEDHLVVQALAVRPDHQGRGLGTALLQLAEREARRQGRGLLKLSSPEVMTESLALCLGLGFRETRRQTYWDSQIVFLEKALA
ncbi:GNAT family N-acetyltransferase [Pelagibius sp.]|uniref:GNAT family N-acetyltransferase n=1 Tax=Pelagibius sp. TaxID=1931238 RepID=UPI00261C6CF9|nr:GNAT family N-acetyltransferase [Pelagibius sp.]